jgi:hypothetical protein
MFHKQPKKPLAPRLEGFLREQLLHRATPLAARFLLGPCRRSACFLDVEILDMGDRVSPPWLIFRSLSVVWLWCAFAPSEGRIPPVGAQILVEVAEIRLRKIHNRFLITYFHRVKPGRLHLRLLFTRKLPESR